MSFNELALGSDLPTQRPAPSRPAEASSFATMMDEADARMSANDRASETRASVETRDTARADCSVAAEQPASRDTKDAPATDTGAQTTAPAASDKAATVSTDTNNTAVAPQDKASAPRDTGVKSATAPAASPSGNGNASAASNTADQPATPVAAGAVAPQAPTDQTSMDESAASATPVLVQVPAVALIHTPAPPTSVAATVVPTFVADKVGAPIDAPHPATPVPQSNDSQTAQPQPQQAASQPNVPQTTPAAAGNPDDAALFATLNSNTPTLPSAAPIAPAPGNQVASNAIPSPVAANATTNAAPSQPADRANNLTAATLFAATALSQPVTDSDALPQVPLTPQAPAANTAEPAATQTTLPAAPQTTKPTDSSAPLIATTTAAETPAPVDPNTRQANNASATQPTAPNAAPTATAAASAPMTAATLAALIGTSNIEITVDQAVAPAPLKPAPALANGMVTPFANAPSGETKTSTPTSLFGGVDGSTATQSAVPMQTAMAVAAAPVAQDVADDSKPKLAATADGLVINAAAPTSGSHTLHTAATDAASAASKPTVPNQPVFDQVAVHVAKAAAEGLDKINIKLKPLTLGQIDVQLEVATDGRVHAVIAADKPETLELLQRDARSLERALGDAGLRTDSGSLSFNLRGQNQQQFGGNSNFAGFGGAERASNDIALPIADNAMRLGAYINSRAAAGGVDIRV